jgi:hypothetical protein
MTASSSCRNQVIIPSIKYSNWGSISEEIEIWQSTLDRLSMFEDQCMTASPGRPWLLCRFRKADDTEDMLQKILYLLSRYAK